MKSLRLIYSVLILIITDCCFLRAQIITTIAGNGLQGYSGNGGQAKLAANLGPWGTVADRSGNIFFADPNNSVISKVDVHGIITKWAGTGVPGYSGDGGPANVAQLVDPEFLTGDDQGNLYFVDDENRKVRKIDTAGIITTVAGNGVVGYSGDGGPALSASFNLIFGATPDHQGNLFISDLQNQVIRKVDAAGIVTTIAGTGAWGFSGDGGPATLAQLNSPLQVAVDRAGNIYIPDELNYRIRKIDQSGIITTIAGDGTYGHSGDGGLAVFSRIGVIYQVHIDASGQIYLLDNGFGVVRKIDCAGIITTYAGSETVGFGGDGGPATSARLQNPTSIGSDITGNTYISDASNFRLRKVANIPDVSNTTQPVSNKICQGSDAIFTCQFVSANIYQWQVFDGEIWIGLRDNALYTGSLSNSLTIIRPPNSFNGNRYRCVIASSCQFYISNTDTLFVSGVSNTIGISIPSDSICKGTTVVFSANVQNIQPDLIYDWKLNGSSTGTNSPVFSTNTLSDNDYISCTLTNISSCSGPVTVESNIIRMQVTDSLYPTITISSSGNPVCFGEPVYFIADATHAGNAPLFKWEVNGSIAGGSLPEFQSNTLLNGDVVSCLLISSLSCTAPVQSGNMVMVVHPLPQVDAGNDTTITPGKSVQLHTSFAGNIVSYDWSPAVGLDDPARAAPVASPAISTNYHLWVTDNYGCKASDSVKIIVYSKLRLPNAFSPDGNGINDLFRIPPEIPITIKRFSIYNRWGVRVFEAADAGKGWDGRLNGIPQVTGTYVWIIEYTDPISSHMMKDSGTVILMR